MSRASLVRAWKDEEYRDSLTEAPESPVGSLELADADLDLVAGGGVIICGFTVFVGFCKNTIANCLVSLCLGSVN